MTPAQMDQNLTDIEAAVNAQETAIAASLNPDGTLKNNSVATAAIQDRAVTLAKLSFLSNFYAVAGGTANALTATFVPPATAYVDGMVFWIEATADNTGPATLQIDALAATPINKVTNDGLQALEGGEIQASCIAILVKSGGVFQLVASLSVDQVPGASLYAVYEEQQPANTGGGTFTAGAWEVRGLNTEVYDPDGIGVIVANAVRLQPGRYRYQAKALSFRAVSTRLRLYNVTAVAAVAGSVSLSGNDETSAANGNQTDESNGEFIIAVQSDIRVEHRCSTTSVTFGLGAPANIDGLPESYCRLELWKLE